jgi:2-methylcitrate dehydratase PrpD
MSHGPTLTTQLADFALETDTARLPAEVRHEVRRAILDSLGVAIAGATHPASGMVVDTLPELIGPDSATVMGFRRRTDAVGATLANGVMAHVLDWDDTLLPMRLHQSATLVPALLATGEINGSSGSDLIAAFAAGFEIQARLAAAISPVMPERGWHGTGIVGGIGVAAAVSRLLRSDSAETTHAMGIAGTAAAGLVATFGSMSKALNLGRAAALGVQSAQLAARGFTSHADLLGAGNFLGMYDDAPRMDHLLDHLGSSWAVLDNGYKPYPCGVVAHAAIDAILQIRADVPADDAPAAIHLTVSPETIRLMGKSEPATGLEAKFSVAYAAAVAWVDGNVLPGAFEDATVATPAYRALLRTVDVESSAAVAQDEAICEVRTASGWTGTAHVEHARGTRARPLDDLELQAKFRAACEFGGVASSEMLIDVVHRLEDVNAGELMRLLGPGARKDVQDGGLEHR